MSKGEMRNIVFGTVCVMLVVLALVFFWRITQGAAGGVNFKLFREANDFNLYRRITVMNTRTDEVMLQLDGYIAINDNDSEELVVTMQTGNNDYIKHYIYLNEWTCYVIEQIEPDTESANEITYYPRLRGES